MKVNLSLGGIPGMNPVNAMKYAFAGGYACEPLAEKISFEHVQVCPQNFGTLTSSPT